jgi:outer membrane protein assembly factor BamB
VFRRFLAAITLVCLPILARAEEWPRFRGPTGQGVSAEKNLPKKWGRNENIVWKAEISGDGWSSPIVWGDRVFATTATEDGQSCRILALSRLEGKQLWNVEVCRQKKTHKIDKNSYATPTPVTDGENVYAVFNDGSIAAVTVEGKPVWVNRDVKYYSQHGLGGSPILYHDTLIMSFDGSSAGEDKTIGWQKPWDQSFLLGLDKKTGKERWRARRGLSRIAHTTPIVIHADGSDTLISTAGDVIQGFDPETGARLWSVRAEGEGVVPSPVFGEGLVFAASGFGNPRLRAVKLKPDGEETTRKVVWETNQNVPMMPSAVFVKPYLFVVSEKGFAMCLEAATGKVKWRERLGGNYSASPVAADESIYFLSEEGETVVIPADGRFEIIARNSLGESCQASMAVAHGQLFIRTQKHLFCIGSK